MTERDTAKTFFINELVRLREKGTVREAMRNQNVDEISNLIEEEKKILLNSVLTDYFADKNNLLMEKTDIPKGMLYETLFLMYSIKAYNYSAEIFRDRVEFSDLLIEEEEPIPANIALFIVAGIPVSSLTLEQFLGMDPFK